MDVGADAHIGPPTIAPSFETVILSERSESKDPSSCGGFQGMRILRLHSASLHSAQDDSIKVRGVRAGVGTGPYRGRSAVCLSLWGNVLGLRTLPMCLPPSDEGGARRAEGEKTPSFSFCSHRGRKRAADGRPYIALSNAVSDLRT